MRGLPESEQFAFDKWSAVASRPPFEPTMEGGAIIVRSEDFYPLVALKGTVRVGEYEGKKEPRIVVSGIETGLEPERDYIYP